MTPPKGQKADNSTKGEKAFLQRKCSSYIKELSDMERFTRTDTLRDVLEEELSIRLELLSELKHNFETVQSKLEEHDFEELNTESRTRFISIYIKVKTTLMQELRSRHVPEVRHSSTIRHLTNDDPGTSIVISQPKARLPKLQIPKFGGLFTEWPDFYSMFKTLVGNDPELTKIEKFQHLRTSLKDSALDSIRSLEINDANYDKALGILLDRFDNKRLTFQAHIKELFNLKQCEKGAVDQLRELSDKFNANLRAIQTIATKEQIADGLLTHLIVNKFDVTSQIKWEETTPVKELPSLDSVLTFWNRRCQMLESVENATVTQTPSKQVGKKSTFRKALIASNVTLSCLFCDSSDHYIYRCKLFLNLSPELRLKEAKRLQLCTNCLRKGHYLKSCKSSGCRDCGAKHHTLLHATQKSTSAAENSFDDSVAPSTSKVHQSLVSSLTDGTNSLPKNVVLLATAVIFVKNYVGSLVPCRALLDSASQLNFVSSRCPNLLQLKRTKSTTLISGIGQTDLVANHIIQISMQSRISDYTSSFTAVVTPSITENQPNYTLNNIDWQIPSNIQLADPSFYKSQRIDILIGAEIFFDLLCVGQIRLSNQLPLLQKTRLGWVVSGGALPTTRTSSCLAAFKAPSSEDLEDASLDELVNRFWEVENISSAVSKISQEDLDCEKHFQEHYGRLDSGKYTVRLPFKRSPEQLGDSYGNALNRFRSAERKLDRNPELKMQYSSFMSEYASLGHMSPVETIPPGVTTFFLPHHCVLKAESTTTKLRVVFDGSAQTSSGLSLNDILMTGPTIQPKLFETLLRFRSHKVALTGDIGKMYRCIRMSYPDNYLQCILWRPNQHDKIQIFKLDTVTYGTKPASYLAVRSMQQLATDECESFPIGSAIVLRDFYVDDLISGGESVEEVLEVKRQTSELLSKGNFMIRKWCSNSRLVLSEIKAQDQEKLLKFNDGTSITKALGLCWNPDNDELLFSFSPQISKSKICKRSVLSMIARFYDPLGLIGPVIAKAKIFLQLLWKEKLQWDESIPQSLQSTWIELCHGYELITKCSFPRFVLHKAEKIIVHAFCDASLLAYGACIYVSTGSPGTFKTTLLCSKSRVSPLKTLTIPKLELCAATLLAELVSVVAQLNVFGTEFHCWSDSTIVLSWIKESPSNFNVFVANRISTIKALTSGMDWHYVPTEMNPADILSRGATPKELEISKLWKNGPEFLRGPAESWPQSPSIVLDLPERRKRVLASTFTATDYSTSSKYANTFPKMQRIYAYIYKFTHRNASLTTNTGCLSSMAIKFGTKLLFRMIQRVHLATEYRRLQENQPIDSSSKIYSLNAFLDSDGLMRVGGRLKNSTLDFESKHPIILPKKHPVTDAVIDHYHRKLLHAGPQSLLASIRLQYWPIGGKATINRVLNKCIICFRAKPKLYEHVMGNLPLERVQANRAFLVTGVDFCGPFFYKSEVRNKPPIKCYVSLFVCFATKAIYMDLVSDLSTPAFIAALKRFVALRGKPKTIWSDNATNFVGAKNELADLRRLFHSNSHTEAVTHQCLNDGIDWQFIPPRSPHFGGLWEASIKSAKYHFKRTVGAYILTYDELRTLTCQISAILNSRPLYPISENPNDIDVLTPAHFLTGAPLTSFVEPDVTPINLDRLDRWQRVSRIQQTFWDKWSKEYLTTLQQRAKWRTSKPNLPIGTIVLIKDDNLPPMKWQLARIIDTIKGNDGVSRIALLKTSCGTTKRAIQKLCPLPIEGDYFETHGLPTRAGC